MTNVDSLARQVDGSLLLMIMIIQVVPYLLMIMIIQVVPYLHYS